MGSILQSFSGRGPPEPPPQMNCGSSYIYGSINWFLGEGEGFYRFAAELHVVHLTLEATKQHPMRDFSVRFDKILRVYMRPIAVLRD